MRPEVGSRSAPPPLAGLLFGLALLGTLGGLDIVLDDPSATLVAAYVAAPFITAFVAGPWITGLVGCAALALGFASPEWNMNDLGDVDWVVRVVVISIGSIFAVASAWLRERGRARAERLHRLDALGEVADGSLPLAETLARVTEVIVPAVADVCMIDAVHDGRATRIATRASGHPDAEAIEERIRRRPSSAPKWLIEVQPAWRRVPRWLPRMGDEELRRLSHGEDDLQFLRSLGLRSSISVAITARDRNLGVLTLLTAWSGRRYGLDDVRFAQILSGRIGLALDNAGLFSDLESIERRMDTVMSIVDEAVVIQGSAGELVFANPAAARMLGFESSAQAIGTPTKRIREQFLVRDEHGRELDAEALVSTRASTDPLPEMQTLRVTERVTGRERWTRTKAKPVRGAAGETLYWVTVIEDVTDVKRAEFAQRLLARTGELVSHSEDYLGTLREVPPLLVPEFADGCSVNLARDNGLVEQVAVAHPDLEQARAASELRQREPVRVDDSTAMARVLRTGEPVLIRDEEDLERGLAGESGRLRAFRDAGVVSLIIAPMPVGGRIVGALTFVNQVGSRRFDDDDLDLALELARRVAMALENARLAEERVRVADALQRELLPPSLPSIPGWEVATMYEPAGEVNEVGGDFYEVFRVRDGWAVLLGDVSGRGAVAASLTAEARHTIRTAGTLDGDPRTGLHVLDANLRDRDDAALCSVALVVLPDPGPADAAVELYLAGHPHPLLIRKGGAQLVGEPGPLLGVIDDADWRASRVRIEPGDQIVLYTDGVIEARGRTRERFGTERLRRGVAPSVSPHSVIERVRRELDLFGVAARQDDAALVALRFTGYEPFRSAPFEPGVARTASSTSAAS
ncbi:MAG TPA: SpoIIE family protein phosphatase [Solirubrobacterales bacterium]|nr:SpoIIE family protein phosphatase [Solirubrobacterales bacterium]